MMRALVIRTKNVLVSSKVKYFFQAAIFDSSSRFLSVGAVGVGPSAVSGPDLWRVCVPSIPFRGFIEENRFERISIL